MAIQFNQLRDNGTLVGVYGTLKDGQPNHHLLGDSMLVEEGWLAGLALHDLGPFPGAVIEANEQPIFVEVYSVSDAVLAKLDKLESYDPNNINDSLFIRKYFSNSDGLDCWIYLFNEDTNNYPLINTGIWVGEGINF
ncbi:gamma-glutamylcyclotransferase family protein [uncultured Zhongshania sp.]|uniref:gamma-glutamylcyclotransferase family protein n=1 Tax=uncultured Zhongshania sp. TaxID=1642288 RepID=UPI0030D989FE|tara:strand:+ start:5193 stop:5603 length:411 start_codon:yes stop_codon:yes gene_type:complete